MVRQRPRRAQRSPLAVRVGRFAVPGVLVALATTGVVSAATGPDTAQTLATPAASAPGSPSALSTASAGDRRVSRDALRPALTQPSATPSAERTAAAKAPAAGRAPRAKPVEPAKPKPPALTVVDREYTRVDLNVRAENDADSKLITVLDAGSRVSVTATVRGGWRYVSHRGRGAWVKDQYLVERKPKAATTAAAGPSSAPCKGGSAVESGLTPDAVAVYRTICARFPSVTAYGGARADSLPEHPSGRALDSMVPDSAVGWQIARYMRANAKRLGVSQVLWAQQIWTVQRSGEGWRSFADRGSVTANHLDHVHVTVYGNAAG